MKKFIFFILGLVILFVSCTTTENITLLDGNTISNTKLEIDEFFSLLLEDFEPFIGEDGNGIMQNGLQNLAFTLSKTKKVNDISLREEGDGNFNLYFTTKNLEELLTSLNNGKKNSILSINRNELRFSLSIDNYSELKDTIPLLSDKNFEVYGPEYSNGMSEEEYNEMISYLLGEESVFSLNKSYVTINITTPNAIKEYNGITKTGNNTAKYKFPIIDFLLLNKPLEFSLSW